MIGHSPAVLRATFSAMPFGVWTRQFNYHSTKDAIKATRVIEDSGYSILWTGETSFRDPFALSSILLSSSQSLRVGVGVANIWGREPFTMKAGQLTLSEAFPERFVLGVGVSHRPHVENVRGRLYERPLLSTKSYLERLDRATTLYDAPMPDKEPITLVAALGPQMLRLAKSHAHGAITYLVPPGHTKVARCELGVDRLLCVEQAIILSSNIYQARKIARSHLQRYLAYPNYVRNWQRLGFAHEDLAGGGSDEFVDAVVSHGSVRSILDCLNSHLAAGADHVCVQVLSESNSDLPVNEWAVLGKEMLNA